MKIQFIRFSAIHLQHSELKITQKGSKADVSHKHVSLKLNQHHNKKISQVMVITGKHQSDFSK
jgi:hypothetical protein